MAAFLRPRVVGFELCSACGCVVWRCRLQRGGTVPIDPRPVSGGLYVVVSGGRLRGDVRDPSIVRYTLHVGVCPVIRRRSEEKSLRSALEWEIAQAIEEARRPRPPEQLSLLPPPRLAWHRWRDGWIDLTDGLHRGAPYRPWNGCVVVDLTRPSEPVLPN